MRIAPEWHPLIDTNVLLRFVKPDDRGYALPQAAVRQLWDVGGDLCYTSQNLVVGQFDSSPSIAGVAMKAIAATMNATADPSALGTNSITGPPWCFQALDFRNASKAAYRNPSTRIK